jgi:hypothetical protein
MLMGNDGTPSYIHHHCCWVNRNLVIIYHKHCKFSDGGLTISASSQLVGLHEKA